MRVEFREQALYVTLVLNTRQFKFFFLPHTEWIDMKLFYLNCNRIISCERYILRIEEYKFELLFKPWIISLRFESLLEKLRGCILWGITFKFLLRQSFLTSFLQKYF